MEIKCKRGNEPPHGDKRTGVTRHFMRHIAPRGWTCWSGVGHVVSQFSCTLLVNYEDGPGKFYARRQHSRGRTISSAWKLNVPCNDGRQVASPERRHVVVD